MPLCKKAWATDKVGFSFKYDQDWQTLYTLISTWDDSKDVVILIDFCPLPLDEMDEYLDKINHAISQGMFINKDMFLMGFHPEDEGNELLDNEFESTVETPYGMVFLQRLSKLQEASDALRGKGYYKIAQQYYDADFLYGKQRQDFYRRLKSEKAKKMMRGGAAKAKKKPAFMMGGVWQRLNQQ